MKEEIEIIIKAKHFRNSSGYCDNDSCPLALAIKDKLKCEKVSVTCCNVIIDENSYVPRYLNFLNNTETWCNDCVQSIAEPYIMVDDLIKRANQKKKIGTYKVTLIKK